ncbi:hypothetical protein ACT453_51900, partial [Bacillus sp. D-CC]
YGARNVCIQVSEKGYAKVAKRDSLTKEEREEYLQIIEDETDSVTDLVQDLFMLVQLEQHQFVSSSMICKYSSRSSFVKESLFATFA